jgi:antitoxin component YwqK of YwqJK toxin-antitoxin module
MNVRIMINVVLISLSACSGNRPIEKITDVYENGLPKSVSYYHIDTSENNKFKVVHYYESGARKGEVSFYQGSVNGTCNWWYEDGNLQREGVCKNGKVFRMQTDYYDQIPKQRSIVRVFQNGQVVLERTFHKNGRKESDIHFQNGRMTGGSVFVFPDGSKEMEITDWLNGRETKWYSNGKKREEGNLKDGSRFGKWYRWDSSGKELPEIYYNEKGDTVQTVSQ